MEHCNMKRISDPGPGRPVWKCVDCEKAGYLSSLLASSCDRPGEGDVLGAVAGTGRWADEISDPKKSHA